MKLNSLFQNGAVLQRELAIPVWGRTVPKTLVKATLGGAESFAKSAGNGDFMLRLPPLSAGGPYQLVVTNLDNGDSVTVDDVLVGDVWIASGQSNMEYRLKSHWKPSDGGEEPLSKLQEEEYCASIPADTAFRFFNVAQVATGTVETDVEGQWLAVTPENALQCSAVSAWFGRYVQAREKVPMGIIHVSWGGTIVEAWMSRSALLSLPGTAAPVAIADSNQERRSRWDENGGQRGIENLLPYLKPDSVNTGVDKGWASMEYVDDSWRDMQIPGSWIGQQIGGNGAFWFRKYVTVPMEWAGHDLLLETGGIDKHDISYFNGVEIGRTGKDFETSHWDEHRRYRIPARLVKAGHLNVFAIRAFSFAYQGTFWGEPEDYMLRCDGTDLSICLSGTWKAQTEYDRGFVQPWESMLRFGPGMENTYGILFNSMLKPVIPYGIKGVIWYQGESNANSRRESVDYRTKIGAMIRDWRYQWGQGDFPFIQVQLANFRKPALYKDEYWPYLRDSQRLVCEDLPQVYMIPTIDIGDEVDIHPQNKKDVGRRLADNALANTYGYADVVPDGPMFTGVRRMGHEIRVMFDYAAGMYLLPGGEKSFWLAGRDKVFHQADKAAVVPGGVVLSSAAVATPLHVRYAWADNPVATLFNGAGLPASSFSSL